MLHRILVFVLLLIPAAAAAEDPGAVEVLRVVGGARLALADGRTLRLAGIRVPEAVEDGAGALLARRAVGRAVRLEPAEIAKDRWGDLVAHVEDASGTWLQGLLLEAGLAMVQTRPGEAARAARMLALERAARDARRGLWQDPGRRPLAAAEAGAAVGGFHVVQGRPLRAAPTRNFVYLNFGEDWRTDFTLRFRRAELDARFRGSPLDPERLVDRAVEVRGFVLEAGGPLIEVSHPEQIEILP